MHFQNGGFVDNAGMLGFDVSFSVKSEAEEAGGVGIKSVGINKGWRWTGPIVARYRSEIQSGLSALTAC